MILTLRTDNLTAEVGLYNADSEVASISWAAHRELSNTLLKKIDVLLSDNNVLKPTGIVVYAGPGSFTGLRIGFTVAKTLAYAEDIPIVSTGGESWQLEGVARITRGENEPDVLPDYGGEANITKPRK